MKNREKLELLRKELDNQNIDGFIIPHGDEFRSESLPESSKRLEWLTGFSGSAGTSIVLKDKAAVFVDSRYTLQAPKEVDGKDYEIINIADKRPSEWLAENMDKDAKIGFDAWQHTPNEAKRLQKACKEAKGQAVAVEKNPVDAVWKDRPEPPKGKIFSHPIEYSGCQSEYKRRQIAQDMKKQKVNSVVITDPSSVAWLLNIRGKDVDFTPKPLAFAVIHDNESVDLITNPEKLDKDVKEHLGNKVNVVAPENISEVIEKIGKKGNKVQVDPASVPMLIQNKLEKTEAKTTEAKDPCLLPKACKNKTEQEGARNAHIRDGAALTKFLAWFDENAPKETLTEISASDRLEEFRKEHELYRGPSFATISAAGENGAIVHYEATEKSNAPIKKGQLYLLDSGGQYPDGTTDVTRTVAVGKVSEEAKKRFTQVLKGNIALDKAKFPEKTTGYHLDVLARQPLWEDGQDFGHGTGHGIGSYLDVHEGPQSISQANRQGQALEDGMLVSNEPGYYKEGDFGIRIENVIMVKQSEQTNNVGRKMMSFETLTLAPIDRTLIKTEMLTPEETKWIDSYHTKVREKITPLVDKKTAAWLKKATAPLRKSANVATLKKTAER